MARKYVYNPLSKNFDIVSGDEENCLLSLAANQVGLVADIAINLVDTSSGSINNNIIFNNTTHRATLKAGKTYKLLASLRVLGDGSDDAVWFRWYNISDSSYIGVGGLSAPDSSPSVSGSSPVASAIISPSSDIEIELKYQTGGSSPGISVDTAWATIEKISDSIYTVMTVGSVDEKLKRVDTGIFETAQETVEYYSPTQHGRIYGIVYRKYFSVPNIGGLGQSTTVAIGATPSIVFNIAGYVLENTTWNKIILGVGSGNTASNMGMYVYVNGSTIHFDANDGLDWESGKCWIDYTK